MLRFCWPCLSTLPTAGHARAHSLAQYIGKGRLLYRRTFAINTDADATRAWGMCSTTEL